MDENCSLGDPLGGELIWRDSACRVVLVEGSDQAAFSGYCRVIWNKHQREMSDLATTESQQMMTVVFAVERLLRRLLDPDKINLASLGNVVPHLHWHVIPRWRDDSHFPAPIWDLPRHGVSSSATAQSASVARPPCSASAAKRAEFCPAPSCCAVVSSVVSGAVASSAPTRKRVTCATLSAALALELEATKVTAP